MNRQSNQLIAAIFEQKTYIKHIPPATHIIYMYTMTIHIHKDSLHFYQTKIILLEREMMIKLKKIIHRFPLFFVISHYMLSFYLFPSYFQLT